MKKTLITLLSLSGVALGAAVTDNGNGTLSATGEQYVYSWTGSDWLFLQTHQTSGALQGPWDSYYPASANDGAIIGYSYDADSGLFTAASATEEPISGISINTIGASHAYFSGNFKFAAGNGDFKSTLSTIHLAEDTTITIHAAVGIKHALTLDYGDMTDSTSLFQHTGGGGIWTDTPTSLTLGGSYTYHEGDAPKVIFTTAELRGALPLVNAFVVKDYNGTLLENIGVITDMSQLGEGQSAILWKNNTASLVAIAPEPATATLSLLALAGLAVRRKRC